MTADPSGRIYDLRAGLKSYYRYGPRRFDQLINDPFIHEVVVKQPKIHASVFERIRIGATNYAPFVPSAMLCGCHKERLDYRCQGRHHLTVPRAGSGGVILEPWSGTGAYLLPRFAAPTLFLASAAIIDDNVRRSLSLKARRKSAGDVACPILWPLDWEANAVSCLTGLGPWLVQKISSANVLPTAVHDAVAWVATKFSAAAEALVQPSVEIAKSTLPSFLGSRLDVYWDGAGMDRRLAAHYRPL